MSITSNVPRAQTTVAEPSPALFWFTVNAYQQTAALKAGIELEVFTAVAEGHVTADAIAERCVASTRGVRILLDYLTVLGFLQKQNGAYALTLDSEVFLDRRSPAYLGGMLRFINTPDIVSAFDHLTEAVRTGTTQLPGAGVVDREDPVWVDFARHMKPLVGAASEYVAEVALETAPSRLRVLDLAAGHGLFGIEIARRVAAAEIVAVDWPQVLEVALENAEAADVRDQYTLLPGDAFTVDFGTGFDVVLLTNLLHHFNLADCQTLADKAFAALKPNGRAITLEFVPNADRVAPPIPATFALMMLGVTPEGDAYTFDTYEAIFRQAGFARSELRQVPRSPQQLVVSYR